MSGRWVAFTVALIVLTALVGRYGASGGGEPAAPRSTLADRLNGACRPGYQMTDWSTTDELGNPLGDTVMVECSSVRLDDVYGLPVRVYRLAVAR